MVVCGREGDRGRGWFAPRCVLRIIAPQIFTLESQYLEKANPRGNALKGVCCVCACVRVHAYHRACARLKRSRRAVP